MEIEDELDTSLYEYDPGTGSEQEEQCYRRLWCAVLLCALADADGRGRMLGVVRSARKRATWRARKWLTTDSEDLRAVCEHAGFRLSVVLRHTRKRYGKS